MNNLHSHYDNLKELLSANDLTFEVHADRAVVQSSTFVTAQTIQLIVESLTGFSLLFSQSTRFAFTIIPCRLPIDFQQDVNSEETSYFTTEEVHELLRRAVVDKRPSMQSTYDPASEIETMRMGITPALNGLLSEILAEKSRGFTPIIEVGSGEGYSFSSLVSSGVIRTQPESAKSCYPVDVEELCTILGNRGKHVPLLFGIDVFDVMTPDVRRRSLKRMGTLQSPGDQTLIFLDTNPYMNTVFEEIQTVYSDKAVYPLFYNDRENHKLAILLVPPGFNLPRTTLDDFFQIAEEELEQRRKGQTSQIQRQLNTLRKRYNLRDFYFEDFYVEQVKKDLIKAGYESEVYLLSSFTRGETPFNRKAKQDLIYKAVTGAAAFKEWSLGNDFDEFLQRRNLRAPVLQKDYPQILRERGETILGTEILMIQATKI